MPRIARRLAIVVLSSVIAATSVTGCSSAPHRSGISVVTSTDVYGDIVRQIAGSEVSVTSFISDPNQDPHSFEADTRSQLALSRATIVIENGGGYDDFMTTLLRTAGNDRATVLNAVTISGKVAPKGGDFNEHVWYDFPTIEKVVGKLVAALVLAKPRDAAAFRARAAKFVAALRGLESSEASIRQTDSGVGVAITEPVPGYLLQACGLVNKTPAAFSEGVENGTDVSAAVLKQTLDLFDRKLVKVLVYNAQTSGPETTQVVNAAKANGIAVVPVTETLPAGKNYLSWMTSNIAALRRALAS